MTLRNRVLAGSLLVLAPGCAPQKTEPPAPPAQTAKPAAPTPSAAPTAPAPVPEKKPMRGDPCTNEGEGAIAGNGILIKCEHGHWDDAEVGFAGVSRAGRNRVAGRRLRA